MSLNLSSLQRALAQLKQVVTRANDPSFLAQQDEIGINLIRAGVIQHFKVTFELCWKFMQRWIKANVSAEQAELPRTRKELFRTAARYGLINEPTSWFKYADARNITSHTYNQIESDQIFQLATPFVSHAEYLLAQLVERNDPA